MDSQLLNQKLSDTQVTCPVNVSLRTNKEVRQLVNVLEEVHPSNE